MKTKAYKDSDLFGPPQPKQPMAASPQTSATYIAPRNSPAFTRGCQYVVRYEAERVPPMWLEALGQDGKWHMHPAWMFHHTDEEREE